MERIERWFRIQENHEAGTVAVAFLQLREGAVSIAQAGMNQCEEVGDTYRFFESSRKLSKTFVALLRSPATAYAYPKPAIAPESAGEDFRPV